MIGRRPKRSDNAPRTGEKRNCIVAQAKAKYPMSTEARATLPPSNPLMRSGRTGAMMPMATRSSVTVMRMKMTGALDLGLGVVGVAAEDEGNWHSWRKNIVAGNG